MSRPYEGPLATKRILVVINVDSAVLTHRLALVKAAIAAGAHVTIACADTGSTSHLRSLGLDIRTVPMSRSGMNPFRELWVVIGLLRVIRSVRPDLIQNSAIKGVVYGTLASRVACRQAPIFNLITGFGYLLENPDARLMRRLFRWGTSMLFRSARVHLVVQNPGARELAQQMYPRTRVHLIEGSGVDCKLFRPAEGPRAGSKLRVLFSGRVLRDKGVVEFIDAARQLQKAANPPSFLIAGPLDAGGNPTALTASELSAALEGSNVEWLGHVPDMSGLLKQVDLVVLPSYHEGLPKALLEGAACGLPLIATDIDGHRPIVHHGENGYLVPVGSADAIADAVDRLSTDEAMRRRFGRRSREIALSRFDENLITDEFLAVYSEALAGAAADGRARTSGRNHP